MPRPGYILKSARPVDSNTGHAAQKGYWRRQLPLFSTLYLICGKCSITLVRYFVNFSSQILHKKSDTNRLIGESRHATFQSAAV